MEEVVGSIPTRSTKSLNHLVSSPFRDFGAGVLNSSSIDFAVAGDQSSSGCVQPIVAEEFNSS